ncbi:MAG TPA: cyclopropane fatty acyl phospholipid synthase [Bryobacteraceae bacterium]|nr:cyclopropane fatty acyl phospholipid synthase [Bryobacteraceae bacterium]
MMPESAALEPGSWRHTPNQEIVPSHPPRARRVVTDVLRCAGIQINGNRPWDIQVKDERFYQRVLKYGSVGAGEAYMDGWWDVGKLDEFFARLHQTDPYKTFGQLVTFYLALKGKIFDRQSITRAMTVSRRHYNLGNDLYKCMLDGRMQYTCAYWKNASTLDQAQEDKLHLICRKLQLRSGMKVLELGGGFGGLAHFMAQEYGCEVVTYNISSEQVQYGRELCKGLPVRFEESDYRQAVHEREQFDRVVSIGLCEHIGAKNYRGFLEIASDRLCKDGLFLLHSIGGNQSYTATDAWVDKYIFPNGAIPSIAQLGKAMEGLWVMEDWHNFGPDYDRTLMAWWNNFAGGWHLLRETYGDRFYRMWKFYLLSCAGTFRARKLQLWQVVCSKGEIPRYTPVR